MKKEIDTELEEFKKAKKQLKDVCKTLEHYENRVQLHTKAISELQHFVTVDRNSIIKIVEKVDKLEKKYGNDIMYQ